MKQIFCQQVRTDKGWQESQLISVNGAGVIETIATGSPSRADLHLPGPVVPTVPNLHSHAFQRAFAGINQISSGSGDSFWTWREQMYAFAAEVRPQELHAIAKYLYVQMLEAGYGCVAEFHYLHHQPDGKPYANHWQMSESLLSAAAETGIGMQLLPVFYAHAGFSHASALVEQRRFVHSIDAFANAFTQIADTMASWENTTLGIAAHSLRAVQANELLALDELFRCSKADGRFHIHISEQQQEVKDCLAAHGCTPLQRLASLVEVDSNWCLIHATHFDLSELEIVRKSGAVVGLCPSTEADLGDGLFPVTEFVRNGGKIGIGSDSHVRVSASEELRLMEYGQRLKSERRNVFPASAGESIGAAMFDSVLPGGAQACARKTGILAPGFHADLMMFSPDHVLVETLEPEKLLDAWIFASHEDMLDSVVISGKLLVEKGRHHLHGVASAAYVSAIKAITRRLNN